MRVKDDPEAIRGRLRACGLAPSGPRMAIYAWLRANPIHPTIDQIFRALRPANPSLSRTTVYNVLHAFVACGLAGKVRTEDLELRYDGCAEPHAHFKCTRCGAILDLEGLPRNLAQRVGLPKECRAQAAAVTFWGLCPNCAD